MGTVLILATFLASSFSLAWQFYREHERAVQREMVYETHRVIACKLGPSPDEMARMEIEFFLVPALIGSRLKGLKNTLLSVIGLTGVSIVYIFWWQYIFWIMQASGAGIEAIPNFAYLAGGNFLDVVIAAAAVLLVVLNVTRAAILSFRLKTD